MAAKQIAEYDSPAMTGNSAMRKAKRAQNVVAGAGSCWNDHRDQHHGHQEAGAAAGMKRRIGLCVLDGQRTVRLEGEDRFMLGAVVLENPANVGPARDAQMKSGKIAMRMTPSTMLKAMRLPKAGYAFFSLVAASSGTNL